MALNMVAALRREVFGACSNDSECEAVCPKGIPLDFIAHLNRDLIQAAFRRRREPLHVMGAPQHAAHEDA
jgi:succinate dehydrogenase / fumarate reductase iron-sulfur subunit